MPIHQSSHTTLLEQFANHLAQKRYSQAVSERYYAVAAKFLQYLRNRAILFGAVEPVHVSRYLHCELARFHRNHGHAPTSIGSWRISHTSGIHNFLRLSKGEWPPVDQTHGLPDTLAQTLAEYAQWLSDVRGLASETISDLTAECTRFLVWYRGQRNADSLLEMAVGDIDDYHRDGVKALSAASGVPFMLHDLRRTFATIVNHQLGKNFSTYTIKRLLNHSVDDDVTGGYGQLAVEDLREPMCLIEAFVLRHAGIMFSSDVSSIGGEGSSAA